MSRESLMTNGRKGKKCFWNYTIESVKSTKQVFW